VARYYQLATFLKRVPNELIQTYLKLQEINNDLTWKNRKPKDIDDIYEFLTGIDGERGIVIKRDFEAINELACPSAMKAIYQSCNALNQKTVITELDKMDGSYERSMWLFLKHRVLFNLATKFDMVRRDSWKYCGVGEGRELKFDKNNSDKFKESIKNFYKLQGDARFCKVEHYEDDDSHFFFAYPEGKAEIIPQYGDSEEEIRDQIIKKLHEVIFVYSSKTGILKTNARGTKEEIAVLQDKFCKYILGLDSAPEKDNVKFNLDIIKQPDFGFVLDDNEINVEGVKLKEIRFVIDKDNRNSVLIKLNTKSFNQSYSNILSSAAMGNNQKILKAKIHYVRIQFVMRKPAKGRRPNVTFNITAPSGCTLEDGETDIIARNYLQKWGIMELLEFGDDNLELAKAEELLEVGN